MTAYRLGLVYAVIGCKLKQNANEGCNSCASLAGLVLSFIACFILLLIAQPTGEYTPPDTTQLDKKLSRVGGVYWA